LQQSLLYSGPKHEKVQQRLLRLYTVKIFPHTPKHGIDGRFITLPRSLAV